jgi:hypothetical protein
MCGVGIGQKPLGENVGEKVRGFERIAGNKGPSGVGVPAFIQTKIIFALLI